MTTATEPYTRTFQRELPVKLNDHELQIYGRQLAEKVQEHTLHVDKKANWNKQANADIQKIKTEIDRLADSRAKGEELRPVNCAERFNNGVIEILRLDRKPPEVVEVRPADMRDLQPGLPGVDDEGGDGDHVEHAGGDVGPDGEDPEPGRMVTSSTGGNVFSGAPDDKEGDEDGDEPDVDEDPDDQRSFVDDLEDADRDPDAPDDDADDEPKGDRKATIAARAKAKAKGGAKKPAKSSTGKRKR